MKCLGQSNGAIKGVIDSVRQIEVWVDERQLSLGANSHPLSWRMGVKRFGKDVSTVIAASVSVSIGARQQEYCPVNDRNSCAIQL